MPSEGKHVKKKEYCFPMCSFSHFTGVTLSFQEFYFVRQKYTHTHIQKLAVTKFFFFQDLEDSGNNVKSHYFPRFYGDYIGVRRDEHSYHMNYRSHRTHKSLITLQFTADEVTFVEHRSPGRIVEALIEDFLALAGSGLLTVVVQNTGSLTADYSVRSSCS